MKNKKTKQEKSNARQTSKLMKYLEKDDKPRFKSYVKKHRIVLAGITTESDNNLLGVASKLGRYQFVSYLLKKHVDPLHRNAEGDMPIHIAVNFSRQAHKSAYTELVLPLVQACPRSLDLPGNQGWTPREMLEDYRRTLSSDTESSDSSECSSDEDTEDDQTDPWTKRLAEEMLDEQQEAWGASHGYSQEQDYYTPGSSTETYDEWASRIYREHRSKQYSAPPVNKRKKAASSADNSGKKPRISDKQREAFNRKMKEEALKHQKAQQNVIYKQRIEVYEKLCQALFSDSSSESDKSIMDLLTNVTGRIELLSDAEKKLTDEDIPWPFGRTSKGKIPKDVDRDKMCAFLFGGLDKDSADYEKYLKVQQRRWHPDRFLQKCGNRISDEHREDVVAMVTKISQILNSLSQDLK